MRRNSRSQLAQLTGWTYYGDLLGVSNYYKLSPTRAYNRLNDFYNTTFDTLEQLCRRNPDAVDVHMLSDSILMTGAGMLLEALELLQQVYLRLAKKNLLLRGAFVEGKLRFDPRLTLRNFRKQLPTDDTLARAVGLASTRKGARLLVESSVAERILESGQCEEWVSIEGYVRDPRRSDDVPSILRRIASTPDCGAHELLYFWASRSVDSVQPDDIGLIRESLLEIQKMVGAELSVHYKETIALLERSCVRRDFTLRVGSGEGQGEVK